MCQDTHTDNHKHAQEATLSDSLSERLGLDSNPAAPTLPRYTRYSRWQPPTWSIPYNRVIPAKTSSDEPIATPDCSIHTVRSSFALSLHGPESIPCTDMASNASWFADNDHNSSSPNGRPAYSRVGSSRLLSQGSMLAGLLAASKVTKSSQDGARKTQFKAQHHDKKLNRCVCT